MGSPRARGGGRGGRAGSTGAASVAGGVPFAAADVADGGGKPAVTFGLEVEPDSGGGAEAGAAPDEAVDPDAAVEPDAGGKSAADPDADVAF